MNNSPVLFPAEQADIDKFIPLWSRLLGRVYDAVFGPFNRLADWLTKAPTRHLIDEFDRAHSDRK